MTIFALICLVVAILFFLWSERKRRRDRKLIDESRLQSARKYLSQNTVATVGQVSWILFTTVKDVMEVYYESPSRDLHVHWLRDDVWSPPVRFGDEQGRKDLIEAIVIAQNMKKEARKAL